MLNCGRIKDCMAMCISEGTHPRYVFVTLRYGNRFMDLLERVRLLSLFIDTKRISKICYSHKNDEIFECTKWGSSGVGTQECFVLCIYVKPESQIEFKDFFVLCGSGFGYSL
jgi:hypothetical protein